MIDPLIPRILRGLRHHKLTQDIAFTMGSFMVLAISGIVINIVVTALRDAAALGVFNLAYAVYIVVSQFAAWGLHYSVLRHAAYYQDEPEERARMLYTAGICTLSLGILAAVVVAASQPLFAAAFDSEVTGRAIFIAAVGLSLFPLNKVLLAYLNGLRRMKAFSILQGLRYVTVMVFVSVLAASTVPIEYSTLCFVVAESVTAISAVIYIVNRRLATSAVFCRDWVVRHFAFGSKGLMAGMFAEVNSRVDVLIIGFFLTDRATGIYSFAAMLVDGLYHVLAMIRINFNPMLVAAIRDREWEQATLLRKQSKSYVLPAVFGLSLVLISAFYVFTAWVMPDKGLEEGLPSLLILLLSLNAVAVFVPFDNLLMVTGHPGYQTVQQSVMVIGNAVAAILLLPVIGIEGAAVGTAMSYVCGISMLVYISNRLLGWNLVSNKVRF